MSMTKLGRYQVKRELGRGGMASVYLAHDPVFERDVAVKVLPRELLHDRQFYGRFEREAKAIARLEHPAIVPVYDYGEEDGLPFLVMRYMTGGTLADRLRAGPMPFQQAVDVVGRIGAALDEAHAAGMVHRDVKPGNVLFDHREDAYLSDFGIVKMGEGTTVLTHSGIAGTPRYISPEQAQGAKLDGRSDVYSLGVMAFAMLSGRPPYEADTPFGLAYKHVNEPVPNILDLNPALPAVVQPVLEKAMAKEREARYPTAGAFSQALAELFSDAPVGEPEATMVAGPQPADEAATKVDAAPAAGPPEETAAPAVEPDRPVTEAAVPRRWPWLIGGLVVVLVAAVALFFVFTQNGAEEAPPVEIVPQEVAGEDDVEALATVPPPATLAPSAPQSAPTAAQEPEAAAQEGPDELPPGPPAEIRLAEVDAGFPVLAGGALERAVSGEFSGTTVTMWGPLPEDEQLARSLEPFMAATGIEVAYESRPEILPEVYGALANDAAPDVINLIQPVELAQLAQAGHVIDVTSFIPPEWLDRQYNASWLDLSIAEGPDGPLVAGIWHRFNAKSLVWYPIVEFEAAGYPLPSTWEELLALTDRLANDGRVPWCIGINSEGTAGWVATDWTEDLMLRLFPVEVYDAWVRGELPFNSDEVRAAVELWSEIWFNDAWVLGGRQAIVETSFFEAPQPLFDRPPGCWLHRQASFITNFFPEDTVFGRDYGVFYLPPIDPDAGQRPVLVSGHMMAMHNDRPEVRALMEYFTVPESLGGWLELGGALAPQRSATLDMYRQDAERAIADSLRQATAFRYDGSDNMPAEVGSGVFWEMMVAYVAGEVDLDTALREIDASWPDR